MEFCLATTDYWTSVGFNTTNWRKSLNGYYALVHREQAEILVPDIEKNMNITLLKYHSEQLTALLESSEWTAVEEEKEEPTK